MLRNFRRGGNAPTCDLVEVRLDFTGRPARWLDLCKAIENAGWPVLLTIRLALEGGAWKAADEERFGLFEEGLGELAGVDVEWRSKIARPVAKLAKKLRKVCVVSFHDFRENTAEERTGSRHHAGAGICFHCQDFHPVGQHEG